MAFLGSVLCEVGMFVAKCGEVGTTCAVLRMEEGADLMGRTDLLVGYVTWQWQAGRQAGRH